MNAKKIFSLIVFALLTTHNVVSQSNNISPFNEEIIPPSPEAANLGKYGDTPISYNTGTPSVNIPIYEIKGKDLSLPISLSYDSKGIKVEEVASWVGLGWTLNAGGVIARTIRGKPDEGINGYFSSRIYWEGIKDLEYDITNFMNSPKYTFLENTSRGGRDLLPDAFSFNFLGYSGTITFKYMVNGDGDGFRYLPMISPSSDLLIEHPFNGGQNQWKITTPEGIICTFDIVEQRIGGEYNEAVTTSWYLSKVESQKHPEVIKFIYKNNSDYSENQLFNHILNLSHLPKNVSNDDCLYPASSASSETSSVNIKTKYLSSIHYNSNKLLDNAYKVDVNFISSEGDRCDFLSGYTPPLRILDTIRINSSNGLTKNFNFLYSNFGDPCDLEGNYNQTEKRLRLDALSELDNEYVKVKPDFKFSYASNPLSQYGAMIDHWGYPTNQKSSIYNGSFVPSLPNEYLVNNNNNSLATADREPNQNGSKSGLLQSIIYPTGFERRFEFEMNSLEYFVDNYKDYHTHSIKAYGDIEKHGNMNIQELNYRNLHDDGDTQLPEGLPNTRILKFNLNEAQSVLINYNYSGNLPTTFPTVVRLFKGGINNLNDYLSFADGIPVNLTAGDYYLAVSVGEDNTSGSISATLDYYTVEDNYFLKEDIGGVRIRSIKDFYEGELLNEKHFFYVKNFADNVRDIVNMTNVVAMGDQEEPENYTLEDFHDLFEANQKEGSGVLFHKPKYHLRDICGKVYSTAFDQNPYGRLKGHHIGYSEVGVVENNLKHGFEIFKFVNTSNPDFRSQKRQEAIYDKDFTAKKISTYQYNNGFYPEQATGHKFKITEVQVAGGFDGGQMLYYTFNDQYSDSFYGYGSAWRPVDLIVDTLYSENNKSVTSKEFKYYEGSYSLRNQHYPQLLTQKSVKNNLSEVYQGEVFHYPQTSEQLSDVPFTSLHMNNTVIGRTQILYDNGKRSIIRDDLFDYKLVGEFIKPKLHKRRNLVTDEFETETSVTYDPITFNIRSLTSKDGITKWYFWDPKYQFPLVEALNTEPDKIIYKAYDESITEFPSLSLDYSGPVTISYLGYNSIANKWQSVHKDIPNYQATSIIQPTELFDEYKQILVVPKGAMVKTFAEPINGVGFKESIDINGFKNQYDFDNAGRLIMQKDNDNNIISKIRYNYKNSEGSIYSNPE